MGEDDDILACVAGCEIAGRIGYPLDHIDEAFAAGRALMGGSQPKAVISLSPFGPQRVMGPAVPVAEALLSETRLLSIRRLRVGMGGDHRVGGLLRPGQVRG